jgi:hypothetical protein
MAKKKMISEYGGKEKYPSKKESKSMESKEKKGFKKMMVKKKK